MEGIGSRVVRGPHWKWGKQDGGEGRVGTLRSFENHDEVMVVWDVGTAANYRCASHFDLRILDNAPAGLCHEGYSCAGCQVSPIYGIRWDCAECPMISLCSVCYHGDKHSLRHSFLRLSTPNSRKVNVPVRKKSKKISSRGVYPGAKVVRGIDWSWEDQDGGEGHKGKVTKIDGWKPGYPRSAVSVVWDNGVENLYRIGFEGMVDVKAITEAKGMSFYRDHLPFVGEDVQIPEGYYEVGDNVCVDCDSETVRFLQEGHGGWADGMREVMGLVGVVSGVDEDGDVVVQYSSGNRWTFNPIVLKKVVSSPTAETAPQRTSIGSMSFSGLLDQFLPGDVVRVSSDVDYVKRHQQGHGDWVDTMSITLGQVGRVLEVLPSNDVSVEVCGSPWTFAPAVLMRVDTEGGPLTPGTSQNVSVLLRHVFESHQASNAVEELFKASASGDVSRVEEVIHQGLCEIDDMFQGQTSLHVACQNGYIDVVRFLMDRGANPDEEDKDGDLAIHYATLGDEPKVIELLVSYGVDLNTRNLRQQTPLHIAVNKGYITIIQVLLNHHCHPSLQDTGGDTPLHDAIGKKRDDITELLLEGGADITVTNKNGFNCLHHASLRGNLGAVRLIMQYMTPLCNINAPKDDGFTSLHLATLNNHIEVAKVLIQNGANVDSVTENNQTPLHLAVERQNGQIVRLLVEENANVNIPDRYGDTPLHCALRQHTLMQLKELKESPQDVSKVLSSSQKKASSSVSIFLASHGADFTLLNSSKQSPLDLCSESNLIKILQKCREEYQMKQNGINEKEELDKCIMCKSNQRDMLNIPCGHIMLCSSCSSNVSNCNHCDISIQDKIKIEECLVCSEQLADVLFRPCLHMVACESCATLMKKCVRCRLQIEEIVPRIVCQGGKPPKRRSLSKAGLLSSSGGDVTMLQQELHHLKEKTLCMVCMDRRKNCVFLCGHGTCQLCADKLGECPICRKPLKKKIILFD